MGPSGSERPPTEETDQPLFSSTTKLLVVCCAGLLLGGVLVTAVTGDRGQSAGDPITVDVRESNVLSGPAPENVTVVSVGGTTGTRTVAIDIVVENTGNESVTVAVGSLRARTSFRVTGLEPAEPFGEVVVDPGEQATLSGTATTEQTQADADKVEYVLVELVERD